MSEADFKSSNDTYWPDKWFAEKEAALGYGKKSHKSPAIPAADWRGKPPTAKQLAMIALMKSRRGVVFYGSNRGQAQDFILEEGRRPYDEQGRSDRGTWREGNEN